jgi:hypothetical protein
LKRIRIHHSNPNYQEEMEEFKKRLREEEQPRKKITCTFDPFLLPIVNREKLHQEGEVLPW